ncbi:MAG: histone deacetylase family protein [Aquabacterium sp.]|jgi:acetoin utilization deacetylase AcuC-like enzyme|uniref:histone deacetylase family protein n=1 Tax=Aquabacterium sp. TaxID=1872578 RepID=UPI003BAE2DA4
MATGYFTHSACRRHDMGEGHPECPQRLSAIDDHLLAQGLDALLLHSEPPEATVDQLDRAHDRNYVLGLIDRLQQLQASGEQRYCDPDTLAMPHTLQAALRAAGAAIAATDAVITGQMDNAFCAVRPPGHHATRHETMGFCFFNNVAVGVRHALDVHRLKRVAVVDFDVHHGNGTEDILCDDDRVLMVSFFQHPLFPYTGTHPLGRNMVNVPLMPRSDGSFARAAVTDKWLPALEAFRPEMIFISAGFDAHRDDELGGLRLLEADYEWITRQVVEVADRWSKGRIVSCLEGGYSLQALARSVAAHLRVLTGAAG